MNLQTLTIMLAATLLASGVVLAAPQDDRLVFSVYLYGFTADGVGTLRASFAGVEAPTLAVKTMDPIDAFLSLRTSSSTGNFSVALTGQNGVTLLRLTGEVLPSKDIVILTRETSKDLHAPPGAYARLSHGEIDAVFSFTLVFKEPRTVEAVMSIGDVNVTQTLVPTGNASQFSNDVTGIPADVGIYLQVSDGGKVVGTVSGKWHLEDANLTSLNVQHWVDPAGPLVQVQEAVSPRAALSVKKLTSDDIFQIGGYFEGVPGVNYRNTFAVEGPTPLPVTGATNGMTDSTAPASSGEETKTDSGLLVLGYAAVAILAVAAGVGWAVRRKERKRAEGGAK